MKIFLIRIFSFTIFLGIISEITLRVLKLVPDIPHRYTDIHNIQKFNPGQSGYYTKAKKKWNVNKYGWLGLHEISKDSTISIIGDSFIENIMNPIECNQGSFLKQLAREYSFFEAGRSGVTFIEALEISRVLDLEIKPKYQLLYLSRNDFKESIEEIERYNDRFQLSVKNQKLNIPSLKYPYLKKILYNIKTLYYLYLKYPVFVDKQNKADLSLNISENEKFNFKLYNKLIKYSSENYNLNNIIFVMHPQMDTRLIELVEEYGIKTISLNSKDDKSWIIGNKDNHWSCYGHSQVASQVANVLKTQLK
jgi:hypothetical protein